ncbi:tRNA glutamyl-Q(34) synthetase GluQRS [Coralloluteibacterium stylophorae]|uniref:Glutamyl-Q tRNA(Asp) synthetase n=3 Tax=Coralloluteibacterium stylophorae TaxID=1776034 RepID=A0AAP2C9U0_9GAMM|nr:tRNA glutamyl-Q(34) synthetase GluQRS [Coralloluteibacterium stylophorae]MBS7455662.1 tRNA glutamyl-Q(34) synthetase GluQRS [Coralloluteibacterium stylophorae]
MAERYRGRFAPSPTGPLHFGSLVAALGSWAHARAHEGEWLVRIEDIDRPREVAGAADGQLRTLAAFGLDPDAAVIRQSQRHALYAQALARLEAQGDVFACRCSRSELGASDGLHRACVADAHAERPPATRMRAPARTIGFVDAVQGAVARHLAEEDGDFVVRRADGHWAYQLAVVVDDAEQGVTHVVRGADLLDSTPRQILLQQRLGLPTPRYAHLPLVVDAAGRKLGKSLAALPVDPADPRPALAAAWRVLGQDPAVWARPGPLRDLLRTAAARFDMARVPPGPVAATGTAPAPAGSPPGPGLG